MSLVSAAVTGILGEYDHEFEIAPADDFVILYGPNGVGKTKFLEIIDAATRLRLFTLVRQPFETAALCYSDGTVLHVTQKSAAQEDEHAPPRAAQPLRMRLTFPDSPSISWEYAGDEFEEGLRLDSPWRQISDDLWEDSTDGEVLPLESLKERYGRRYGQPAKPPQEIQDFLESVPSFLIETQRLRIEQNQPQGRAWGRTSIKGRKQHRSRIAEQAASIRTLVNGAQTDHSRITQQLDRTFPNRVLEANLDELELDPAMIRERYNDQNFFRSRLGRVASVALEDALSLPERDLEIWELKLLNLYLDDADKKLAPFEGLLQKIELLEQIVNSRLLKKEMHVTDGDGLLVRHSASGRSIDLDSLSSGEQHEVILMIDLLFNVPAGGVVLIDEPEISLHVAWQIAFIPDVRRIAALAGFRFVVATHSPQIINDSWDKAIRLGPPEEPFQ